MDHLARAADDLKLPPDHSRVLMTEAPARWDEYLDLDIPILISHTCGAWKELVAKLYHSGFSGHRVVRLVEYDGAVLKPILKEQELLPEPATSQWCLALNWSHPEEGWRTRLPLWGKHYLVTRQREQGRSLVERLESLGARATAAPTISFVAPDDPSIIQQALLRLEEFDWILFTSPNGVRYFFEYLRASSKDHRALVGAKFACIGPGTAGALDKHGFNNDLLPEDFVAEGLLEALRGQAPEGANILLPRAQEAREVLPETLRERGAEVVVAPVYKTVHPEPPPEVKSGSPDATVLFTSSSTVKNWAKLHGKLDIPCFCIGPVTAQTAREHGFQVLGVAAVHTIDGLVDALVSCHGK